MVDDSHMFSLPRPFARARALRSGERGQVVLLSGVMVFLVMIATMITFDTGKAIHNRIIAQNAVDAAADSAALWQARGCNLLQHLNNLHYTVNETLFIAESAALIGCDVAIFSVPGEIAARSLQDTYLAVVWVAAMLSANVSCNFCYTAPWIDWGQEKFSALVLKIQAGIARVFPVLAFLYADVNAKQSGADEVGGTVVNYVGSLLSQLGLSSSGMENLTETLSEGIGSLPIHIYAFPLDPTSLSLHVEKKKGTSLPWKWPDWLVDTAETSVNIAAPLCNEDSNVYMLGDIDPDKPEKWGWEDEFYWGNPGFMTWIAGKKGRDELLGLGKLKWLSGGEATEEEMLVNSRKMYSPDSVMDGEPELKIPAFVAFASSQVEGEPVISKGAADAQGQIIKVYFPPDSDPTEGEQFLIYH